MADGCIDASQQAAVTHASSGKSVSLSRDHVVAITMTLTEAALYELTHTDITARWLIKSGLSNLEIENRVGPTGSSLARLEPGQNLVCIWSEDQRDNQGTVQLHRRSPTTGLAQRAKLDQTYDQTNQLINGGAYLELAEKFVDQGFPRDATDTYLTHARLQMRGAQMDQALTTLRTAAALAQQHQLNDRLAWIRYWLGNALAATGRPQASLATFRSALDISTSDHLNARLQNYIGLNFLTLGKLNEALHWFEQAQQNPEVIANPLLTAIVVNNLGGLHLRRGDGQRAGENFDHAAATYQQLDDPHLTINALSTAATAYRSAGDYTTALNRLHQALALDPTSGHGRSGLLQSLGKLHADFENWTRARDYYASAVEDVALTQDLLAIATSNWLLGAVEIRLGNSERGAAKLQQAIKTFNTSGDVNGALNAGCTLAQSYLEQGNVDATTDLLAGLATSIDRARREQLGTALACLDQTQGRLEFARKNYSAGEIHLARAAQAYSESAAIAQQIGALNNLAELYLAAGKPHDALAATDQTADLLEQMAAKHSVGLERRAIANSRRGWVDLRVRLGFELDPDRYARDAFKASIEHRGDIPRLVQSQANTNAQSNLVALLTRKSVLINSEQQGPALQKVMLSLAAMETQANSLVTGRSRQPPSLEEVAAELPANTTLLHYHLTQEQGYVWRISNEEISVHKLGSGKTIHQLSTRLRASLSRPGGNTRWQAAAQELANAILAPVWPLVRTNNVVIAADGSLVQVPFAVLPVSRGDDGISRLGQVAHLSYVPWTGVPTSSRVTQPLTATMMTVNTTSSDSISLPGIDQEQAALRALVGTRLSTEALPLVDTQAAQWTLEQPRDILHVSAHAFAHLTEPSISAITAYEDPYESLAKKQALTAIEIAKMNLQSRIVVLNACETGVVSDHIGNETNSLAGAFLNAGAEHVVSSLWRVPGVAAATFSKEFYRALGHEQASIEVALSAAQRKMRSTRQWRHPHFWSGFVLISKPER